MRRLFLKVFIAACTLLLGIISVYIWLMPPVETAPVLSIDEPLERATALLDHQKVFRQGDSLINKDGWLMPDVSKLKKTLRQRLSDSSDVYFTDYETGKGISVSNYKFDGSIDEKDKIEIRWVRTYDVAGRRFCYRMLYRDSPDRTLGPNESNVGVTFSASFYDLDGDGKFETRAMKDMDRSPLQMPGWVKN